MVRRIALLGLVTLAVAACHSSNDPVVAKGDGFEIHASDVKKIIDSQNPFARARYTPEQRKALVESMVEVEIMARAATKEGLDKEPEYEWTRKRLLQQLVMQRKFRADPAADQSAIPQTAVQAYYDAHKADYQQPKKVRGALIAFTAAAGTPERAAKAKQARAVLAKLKAEETKNPLVWAKLVSDSSDDAATKATAGDFGMKAQAELAASYGPELADAVFGMQSGQTSDVVETPKGLYIVKVNGVVPERNQTVEQVGPSIQARLLREKKSSDYNAWRKKLKDDAKVSLDEKAIEAIEVAPPMAAPAGGAMPGMPGGHPGMGGGAPGGMPAGHPGMGGGMPPRAPAPAPAPAPVAK